MLLNKQYNGNKTFILCTNNEVEEKLEKEFKAKFNIDEETFRKWKETNNK